MESRKLLFNLLGNNLIFTKIWEELDKFGIYGGYTAQLALLMTNYNWSRYAYCIKYYIPLFIVKKYLSLVESDDPKLSTYIIHGSLNEGNIFIYKHNLATIDAQGFSLEYIEGYKYIKKYIAEGKFGMKLVSWRASSFVEDEYIPNRDSSDDDHTFIWTPTQNHVQYQPSGTTGSTGRIDTLAFKMIHYTQKEEKRDSRYRTLRFEHILRVNKCIGRMYGQFARSTPFNYINGNVDYHNYNIRHWNHNINSDSSFCRVNVYNSSDNGINNKICGDKYCYVDNLEINGKNIRIIVKDLAVLENVKIIGENLIIEVNSYNILKNQTIVSYDKIISYDYGRQTIKPILKI